MGFIKKLWGRFYYGGERITPRQLARRVKRGDRFVFDRERMEKAFTSKQYELPKGLSREEKRKAIIEAAQ